MNNFGAQAPIVIHIKTECESHIPFLYTYYVSCNKPK